MPRVWKAVLIVVCGIALTFAVSLFGAFLPMHLPRARTYVVPGEQNGTNGGGLPGTVMVYESRGVWDKGGAWFGWLGRVRTDLFLDPGPYTRAQRGVEATSWDTRAPSWERSIALAHAGRDSNGWQARVAAMGWPRPVLYWLWDWKTESVQGGTLPGEPGGVAPSAGLLHRKVPDYALPWRVIWSGLIIDSGVFCAVVAGLVAAFRGTRWARRRRRGECLRCGYDLRQARPGSPCPECGRERP